MNHKDYMMLTSSFALSISAYVITKRLISASLSAFVRVGLCGKDMCKKDNSKKIPEGVGVLSATVFLMATILFIPVAFYADGNRNLIQYLSGLLAICSMILLGFCDDVFNLRWRDKVFLPALASLPLLLVYSVNHKNGTEMSLPKFVSTAIGLNHTSIDLGIYYYVYMGSLAIFCTNSINILAGINGVEAAQSLIIALSVLAFNLIEMRGVNYKTSLFSAFMIIPYIFVTIPVLKMNWYPSRIFVGDTFCYFSGMLFAVVGILGHFGKTMLLFFIPQLFNFLLSLPQLMRIVPCPRHRLPSYDEKTDRLNYSTFKIKHDSCFLLTTLIIRSFEWFGMVKVKREPHSEALEVSNFTILNFLLQKVGPMHEADLCKLVCKIQLACSIIALVLRFTLFDCSER